MIAMLDFVRRLPLSWKTSAMAFAGYTLFALVVLIGTSLVVKESLTEMANYRLKLGLQMLHLELQEEWGKSYSIKEGNLYVGDHKINNDSEIVDHVSSFIDGVVTIFMHDERIATTVKDEHGQRAVGKKLPPGPVYDTVLKNGQTYQGEADVLGVPFLAAYEPLFDENHNTIGIISVGISKKTQMAPIWHMIMAIAFISFAMALIMSVITFIAIHLQARPLTRLQHAVLRLQEDDTSVDIPKPFWRDEIGKLAEAVQVFKGGIIEKLRLKDELEDAKKRAERERAQTMQKMADDFERSVQKVVETVSMAAMEVQQKAKDMSGNAKTSTTQSETVSHTVRGVLSDVQTVASAAQQLNASIQDINTQIENSVTVASTCMAEAEATGDVMRTLNQSAEEVGSVVKMIEQIAGKVNLLALNATIEAARAGESGRGFAVVANEVKNLANQVSKAAQDITRQITNIQKQTSCAVDTISGITETVRKMNNISHHIAGAVDQQGSATMEITESIQKTAHQVESVSQNITGLSRSANETGETSGKLLSTSDYLLSESENLKFSVNKFIVTIRTA